MNVFIVKYLIKFLYSDFTSQNKVKKKANILPSNKIIKLKIKIFIKNIKNDNRK